MSEPNKDIPLEAILGKKEIKTIIVSAGPLAINPALLSKLGGIDHEVVIMDAEDIEARQKLLAARKPEPPTLPAIERDIHFSKPKRVPKGPRYSSYFNKKP